MGTLFKLGRIILAAGFFSVLIAFTAIPATAAYEDDLLPSLNKAIESLQREVKQAESQLARFKRPQMPGKPSMHGRRSKPSGARRAVKLLKLDLSISTDKMEKLMASLSRTVSESRKRYLKAPSNRQLAGSLKSLEGSLKLLAKAKKQGDKAGAEKALRQISSTLNSMKKQARLLASDVKRLGTSKPSKE